MAQAVELLLRNGELCWPLVLGIVGALMAPHAQLLRDAPAGRLVPAPVDESAVREWVELWRRCWLEHLASGGRIL